MRKPPPGYLVAERHGELMPRAAKVFTMLQATPGVVTDHALHYVVWHKLSPPSPANLRHYMSHIKRVTLVKIRRYPGIGYGIVRS